MKPKPTKTSLIRSLTLNVLTPIKEEVRATNWLAILILATLFSIFLLIWRNAWQDPGVFIG